MCADSSDVVHFPRARLVTIRAAGERADRTDVNAHAAFFAPQIVPDSGLLIVGGDDLRGAAVLDTERPHVHAFAANADAAVAHDAARPVEVNHRRPLLLVAMVLDIDKLGFSRAVGEGHVLEFALAARVADRAIEWVV